MTDALLLDPKRLAAVRASGLLDTPPELEFDRLTRIASRMMQAPMSMFSAVEDTRQFFKSMVGDVPRQTPIHQSLCRLVVERDEPLVLVDAAADPEFSSHPAHTELGIRAYLGFPVRTMQGHVLGAFCVADRVARDWTAGDQAALHDVAAEAQAEVWRREDLRTVREQRDLLTEVMRSSAAAITVLSPDGRIVFCNDAAEKILGLRARDVETRTYDAPEWHHTTLDGRPLTDEEQPFRRVMSTGQPVHDVRHCIVWPDGRRRVLSINGAPVKDAEGRVVTLVFHVVDITEDLAAQEALRASQELFSRAFWASPDAISITRRSDGKILQVNRGFTAVMGKTAEECVGRTTTELGLWDSGADREQFAQGVVNRTSYADVERTLRLPDGRRATFLLSGEPFEVNGETHLVTIGRDVTALREAAEAEAVFRRQMQQNQKVEALGTLAGGIAHDFNNLLAGILGHAEFALDPATDAAGVRESMESIHHVALRARDVVRRILAFSRGQDARLAPVTVGDLMRENLELLRATLPRTLALSLEMSPEDQGLLVDVDLARMNQVLLNLAANAAHAMADRGTLTFRVQRTTLGARSASPGMRAGPAVRISVRDHGTGMSPETVARLFEPFFTTKAPGEGTGLGLASVHTLVRQHGGTITAESTPGAGSTFHVDLPLSSAAMPAPNKEPVVVAPERAGARVLFVDDEPTIGRAMGRLLGRLGYVVSVYEDPRAALEAFSRDPAAFDVVVTDYMMPGIPGDEVLVRVLRQRPDIPVVMCSGNTDAMDHARVRALGARRMLEKPVSTAELHAALVDVLPREPGA